ncbi:MAG TPA: SMP-30/gluconolactonase/LRE family protein [Gaiellaceae bacterium]|nr:SMP-30/gluconolactonase/LRE family protein [Gaiellaceae bacterium]
MNVRKFSVVAVTLLALMAFATAGAAANGQVDPVVTFDPAAAEFPESITTDKAGDLYVSMFVLDQIRRLSPTGAQTVVTQLPRGATPAGVKLDASGTLYVAATGFDLTTGQTNPASRGVYLVGRDGSAERMPGTDAISFPNDLAFDNRGNLYVTDPAGGAVWRIDRNGTVVRWVDDPLLHGTGELLGFPYGANGIAFSHGRLIVSNTELGLLVAIPIEPTGEAGEPTVVASSPLLLGIDGIALDAHGDVYCAVNGQNMLVTVRGDGSIEVLAAAAEGLDQPSSVAFGTGARDHQTLFVVNFAVASPVPTPGVLKLTVGVPGQPIP